jgi:hypothetical protein
MKTLVILALLGGIYNAIDASLPAFHHADNRSAQIDRAVLDAQK